MWYRQPNSMRDQAVQRYESLDCLRGIAASIVMIGHALALMTGPSALYKVVDGKLRMDTMLDLFPIRILWSGRQAVILFFVLSGFALYVMLESIKEKAAERSVIPIFVISRWFRLYPVYIFSIALAITFHYALSGLKLSYPAHFWLPTATIDVENILGHMALIGVFDSTRFNNPIWSIIYEMRISILFPIIYLIVCRTRAYSLVFVLIMPVAATALLSSPEYAGNEYRSALILTLHYSSFFVLGALIAHFRVVLVRHVKRFSTPAVAAMLVIAVTLYTYGKFVSLPLFAWCLTDLVAGIGSGTIIVLALAFPILEKSLTLKWLGTVSYSLYLVHASCLILVYKLLTDEVPFAVIFMVMIVLSLLVARMTWILVELRSLQWSRAVRKWQVAAVSLPSGFPKAPD